MDKNIENVEETQEKGGVSIEVTENIVENVPRDQTKASEEGEKSTMGVAEPLKCENVVVPEMKNDEHGDIAQDAAGVQLNDVVATTTATETDMLVEPVTSGTIEMTSEDVAEPNASCADEESTGGTTKPNEVEVITENVTEPKIKSTDGSDEPSEEQMAIGDVAEPSASCASEETAGGNEKLSNTSLGLIAQYASNSSDDESDGEAEVEAAATKILLNTVFQQNNYRDVSSDDE